MSVLGEQQQLRALDIKLTAEIRRQTVALLVALSYTGDHITLRKVTEAKHAYVDLCEEADKK